MPTKYESIDALPVNKLRQLLDIYAKNWLAMDGVWFQSIEKKYGMDEAMEHDMAAWKRFTVIEAKRIKEFLGLEERPGLEGLRLALGFRLYAPLNTASARYDGADRLVYTVSSCRVQSARARKGMHFHPCKPVGMVEYAGFAETIDARIRTRCLSCYPDIAQPESNCVWEFTLEG